MRHQATPDALHVFQVLAIVDYRGTKYWPTVERDTRRAIGFGLEIQDDPFAPTRPCRPTACHEDTDGSVLLLDSSSGQPTESFSASVECLRVRQTQAYRSPVNDCQVLGRWGETSLPQSTAMQLAQRERHESTEKHAGDEAERSGESSSTNREMTCEERHCTHRQTHPQTVRDACCPEHPPQ